MTQTEALRLALEALGSNRRTHHYCEDTWYSCPKHEDGCANDSEGDECNCGADEANAGIDQAITAIKDALEAKDEPVACKKCHLKDTVYDLLGDLKVANLKLSVRSQRTWVGLTYEDMVALQKDLYDAKGESVLPTTFAMAVEAKLKEKNT